MDPVQAVRANIIERLERNARIAQNCAAKRTRLPAIDVQSFFNALADAGDFNRDHPDLAIPPLDPILCKVREPRLGQPGADTAPADRWRTA